MPRPSQGSIPSELGWLVDMLDDYERRIRILEAPSGESLSNAVEKLKTIVRPATVTRLEAGAAIGSVAADFAEVSTPVPDGYTRALVHITAAATLRSNEAAGGWALLMCTAIIHGAGGTFYSQWTSVDGQKHGGVSATGAGVVEGLTPGSTVDVAARVSFPGAYTLGRASVAGSILFLR
jgi:hypothetical protein